MKVRDTLYCQRPRTFIYVFFVSTMALRILHDKHFSMEYGGVAILD